MVGPEQDAPGRRVTGGRLSPTSIRDARFLVDRDAVGRWTVVERSVTRATQPLGDPLRPRSEGWLGSMPRGAGQGTALVEPMPRAAGVGRNGAGPRGLS